jgi:hypothetical protein
MLHLAMSAARRISTPLRPMSAFGFRQPFAGGRFTFTGSLGVMFEGSSNIQLQASNAAMLAIPGVARQIQHEQLIINHDISLAQFFPVVSPKRFQAIVALASNNNLLSTCGGVPE